MLAHSTLTLTPEAVPLGLLAQKVWARDAATFGRQGPPKERALEDKESQKWLHSLTAVNAARRQCPTTHFVSVSDREGDVYDLWAAPRERGVDLLVRAAWNRCLAPAPTAPTALDEPNEPTRLWAAVRAAPLAATTTLHLPRRPATVGQPGQTARDAVLSVRWCAVTLRPPAHRASEGLPEVRAWAIWVVEEKPPQGVVAVEWLLLTTWAVQDAEEALQQVAWYACRWGIEVWHKVLKSGCGIEARQLASAERLRRCLTLYSIIAWRVLYSTMLARALPEAPCTVLLEEDEWQALYCRLHHTTVLPATPPTLREAVRGIAQLGGFLARRGDGEPGVTVLWRGFQHLGELTMMYRIMRPQPQASPGRKNVGKD